MSPSEPSHDSAARLCQRCRHPLDAEAVQCDECGELQSGPGLRDRSAVAARQMLSAQRGAGGPYGRGGAGPRRVPVRAIAKWTGLAAAGLVVVSVLCLGAAWLVDSLALQLMQMSTTAAFGAGAAIGVGVVTALVWKLINAVELWLLRAEEASTARWQAEQARLEAKKKYDAEATQAKAGLDALPPQASPQVWATRPAPVRARPVPSQITLVFAVMGILCGLSAVMAALVPLLGILKVLIPLGPAIACTAIAWTLCYYEGSQRLLPGMSLSLIGVSLLIALGQMLIWGKVAGDVGSALNREVEAIQYPNKPGVADPFVTPGPVQQLQSVINTGLGKSRNGQQ